MENSNFVSSAEWYRSLNTWNKRLWNKLVKADPDRYTKEQTLTASGSTKDFDAPADYYGTVGIAYASDGTQGLYIPIDRLFGDEEYKLLQNEPSTPVGYTFRHNDATPTTPTIRILPPPDKNCIHRYVVAPVTLATDGTDSAELIAGISGFEEFIVIGMAIDAKIKEGSSVVQLRQSMAELTQEIDEMAENRSIDSAGHVHDTRKTGHFDPAGVRPYGRIY